MVKTRGTEYATALRHTLASRAAARTAQVRREELDAARAVHARVERWLRGLSPSNKIFEDRHFFADRGVFYVTVTRDEAPLFNLYLASDGRMKMGTLVALIRSEFDKKYGATKFDQVLGVEEGGGYLWMIDDLLWKRTVRDERLRHRDRIAIRAR